jgi:hypothetical protein
MYDVVFGYVIGTIVGIVLFRMYVKERIVTATLDMLIEQEYVRAYIDNHGITQLYKWHEVDHEAIWDAIEQAVSDMENHPERYDSMITDILEEEENETDDTP